MNTTVRRLTCCCCGADAGRWQQWHNRDAGFGLCDTCAGWIVNECRLSPEEFTDRYRHKNINWGPTTP